MHTAAVAKWGGAVLRLFRVAIVVLAFSLSLPVLADEPLPQPQPQPAAAQGPGHIRDMLEGGRCGSVVIRHCRWRRETSSMVLDPGLTGHNGAPMQWEVVQYAGPDNDEIVVNGQRIRDPGVKEVFDRAFGSPMGGTSMHTSAGAAGARCTTIDRTAATLCSNGGNNLPALDNPLTDWVF